VNTKVVKKAACRFLRNLKAACRLGSSSLLMRVPLGTQVNLTETQSIEEFNAYKQIPYCASGREQVSGQHDSKMYSSYMQSNRSENTVPPVVQRRLKHTPTGGQLQGTCEKVEGLGSRN
jgi:hypothetical protein